MVNKTLPISMAGDGAYIANMELDAFSQNVM
jgi:hypothetical protein